MVEIVFLLSVLFILYTYAGYPLVLALLPARRRAWQQATALPDVTLLISAYNEAAVIEARLENALALDYPPQRLQILVAVDGAEDDTAARVARYRERGVELSYHPTRLGKMAAINRAMVHARGEIVVFSDANNQYDVQAVRRLVAPFQDPRVGATTGAKSILSGDGALGESEGLYWRYEDFIKRQETRLGTTVAVCGEILAVRRALYRPPPVETVNDDFYMALDLVRRGYDVVYVPDAHSYERVSPTLEDESVRRARIVAGRYQAMFTPRLWPRRALVVWQLVSHKFLRPLVPLAMLGAFFSNLLALRRPRGRWGGFARPLLGLQLLFYAAAAFGTRLQTSSKAGRLLFLPSFLVSSNLAALIGLLRYVRGGQAAGWQRARRRPLQAGEKTV